MNFVYTTCTAIPQGQKESFFIFFVHMKCTEKDQKGVKNRPAPCVPAGGIVMNSPTQPTQLIPHRGKGVSLHRPALIPPPPEKGSRLRDSKKKARLRK